MSFNFIIIYNRNTLIYSSDAPLWKQPDFLG